MSDLYDLLGVTPDADAATLKKAYRKRAAALHPDASTGDEEQFKELGRAYEVLSDPQKRARYDRFGDDGTPGSRGAGQDPFGFGAGAGGLGDVLDAFFGSAFGGGQPGRGNGVRRDQPGRDVLVPTTITLEQVATGVRRAVEVEVATTCSTCQGSGSASRAAPTACGTCKGQGQVQRIVRTAFGQLASASPCPTCSGSGTTVADPCGGCRGDGRRVEKRTITLDVKPGAEDGDRLRVSGAGEAGRHGAAAGDLYVEVRVEPHDRFHREGRELVADIDVPITQAALGATLHVPTITGEEVDVTLKAGTQHGDVVTVRRAGLPGRGGAGQGDLHLRVHLKVPTDLDDVQEGLLRELAAARGEDVPERGDGMLSRLRRALR